MTDRGRGRALQETRMRAFGAAVPALLLVFQGIPAMASCGSKLDSYNAIVDAYRAKLDEVKDLDDDPVRKCEAGRDVKPLLQRMKAAAGQLRGCRIKGGVEPPDFFDAMISMAEFTFEAGCPGKGMETCPENVEALSEHVGELFKPYADFSFEGKTDDALCAAGRAIEELAAQATRAVSAVEGKCKNYWASSDDFEAYADGRLVELARLKIEIHSTMALDYKSKCR